MPESHVRGSVYASRALKNLHDALFLCASRFYRSLPDSIKGLKNFLQSPEVRDQLGKYESILDEAQGSIDFLEKFSPTALRIIEIFLRKLQRGGIDVICAKDDLTFYDLMLIKREYGVKPLGPYSLSPENFTTYSIMYKHLRRRGAFYLLSPSLRRILLLKVKLKALKMLEQSFGDLSFRTLILKGGFRIFPHFCRILREASGKFSEISSSQFSPEGLFRIAGRFLYADGKLARRLINEETPLDLTISIKDPISGLLSIPFLSTITIKDEISSGYPINILIDSFLVRAYVESNASINKELLYKKNIECLALLLKPLGLKHVTIISASNIESEKLGFENSLRIDQEFPLIKEAISTLPMLNASQKEIHIPHLDIILVFLNGKLCSAYVKNRRKKEETWTVIPKEPCGPGWVSYPFLNKAQKRFLASLGFKLERE
ncbi:MAG: hypothetical protein NDP13_06335 [Crenarchaeota archaeon]|nr:hypothetical protein [Thermoproteota archaeon]